MSTEDESKEDKKSKMTPQQMLLKTESIYENLVRSSPKIGSRKQKQSTESSSPELNTSRKRRKVGKNQLPSDSSPDDFEESPLRKSLSPKSPKNKTRKKKSSKRESRDSESSPVATNRYTTRTRKAKKKISYADVPEIMESDSEFGSPEFGSPERSITENSNSTSSDSDTVKRRNIRNKKNAKKPPQIEEDSEESSNDDNNTPPKPLRSENNHNRSDIISPYVARSELKSSRVQLINAASENDSAQLADNESQNMKSKEKQSEDDQHENNESEEDMILKKKKATPVKRMPIFLQDETTKMSKNPYARNTSSYYRESGYTCRTDDLFDDGFIASTSSCNESDSDSDEERLRKNNPKRKQILSSDDDLDTIVDGKESNTSSENDDDEEEKNIAPRRSSRKRPSRHSPKVAKALKTITKQRKKAMSITSSESGKDTEENESNSSSSDEEKSPENPKDDFVNFCTQEPVNSKRFHSSQEAGPSNVGNDNGDGADINGDSTVENNLDRADKNKDRDESDQVDGDQGNNEKDDDRNFDEVQDKLVQILREGKLNELPKDTSPDIYPDLLCQAAAISTPKLVGYLIEKFGFDVFEADQAKVGRPLTHAIKAGRADNLPPIMMEMRRKPKKICSEITRWCARDLVKGDISCLKALGDWQEEVASGLWDETSFVEMVLQKKEGIRRVFGTIGENLNIMALKHLVSLELPSECYAPSMIISKCLQQSDRWSEDEDFCRVFLSTVLDCFNKEEVIEKPHKDDKDDFALTPLMRGAQYDLPAAVKFLLEEGANPLTPSEDGTALHIAAAHGHTRCAEIILRKEGQTLSQIHGSDSGWTPVMNSVFHDHWETVDMMLSINLSQNNESKKLLNVISSLRHKTYRKRDRKQKEKNFGMIMKLIKHVAESDQLRHLLNDLVTSIDDRTLSDFILEELMQYPGLVSTAVKVRYIRSRCSFMNFGALREIRRDNLLQDVLSQRNNIDGKTRISATFRNEPAGGPGPTKEFYQMFSQSVVDGHLFKSNQEGFLKFTCLLLLYENDRQKFANFKALYNIVGQMLARAVLNNVPLGLNLAKYIYKFVLDERKTMLLDLEETDKSLFNNINEVEPKDFPELELEFFETIVDPFTKEAIVVPLLRKSTVNNEQFATDKNGYMVLKARETLYNFPNVELKELKEGFHRIFPSKFKELLTARELGALICGELTLNLTDWMDNTIHVGITQETKTNFWRCVESFSAEDRQSLLHFATGLSSLPSGGFAYLPNKFRLVSGYGEMDTSLPTAATCFNQLSLPPYSSQDIMKKQVLIAIRYGSKGFVFS